MRRNACAQTNKAGVMNYDVNAYGSVCRDVKLHDLQFDNYKFGHAFSTSLAMPRDELAAFRSEATEFS
ncbi:hypothetical protein M8J77_015434 [Diaphorina citri]|nr:hypothetical protein M8J77_015434 [Diaphorina citri]